MADAHRDLLFGLHALQNGLIDQGQLVAAFQAWKLDKGRGLADHLVGRGDLDADQRGVVEAMVGLHLKKHGGDAERSLAALPTGRATRDGLAQLGDPQIEATLARVGSAGGPGGNGDADRTATYSVGSATSDGQRFRILRPHARGGLGAVFVAMDTELHREVALKQILDAHADDPQSRSRFLLEAEVTGGLEHPGIVPVYGLGTYDGGRPYYAMRFIRGDDLKEVIERFHADAAVQGDPGRRSLELRRLLRPMTDVCNAVEYAHSRGVLHRDIKPANIIVGKHGETLVVDWGLAKTIGRSDPSAGERTLMPSSASGSSETLPGSAMGTPAYMSPEQAEGDLDRLGPWSDVYSLGATLYCLLTGRPPFAGDAMAVIPLVRKGDFPPPRRLNAAIDPALEAICLRAMALESSDRYPSARALADDIERWAADEPVSAWRESASRRAWRWMRRRRTAVAAIAAAVLAATVGLAAVLGVQTRANAALTSANLDLELANRRAQAANRDLQEANERERARFDLTLEAIRDSHERISGDALMKQAEFAGLRNKLLESARDFYQKLESSLASRTDRRSRTAMGRAYYDLAELTAKIGSRDEALAAHRRGLEVRRAMAREAGSEGEAQADVARSLLAIAGLQAMTAGQMAEADRTLGEARALLERLVNDHPSDARLRRDLARCFDQISSATALVPLRLGEAMAMADRAREILEALVKDAPDDRDARRSLALAFRKIGDMARMDQRPEEALRNSERTREILESLAAADPEDTGIQAELAMNDIYVGIVLGDELARWEEATAAFERARDRYQALFAKHPAVTEYEQYSRAARYHLGRMEWKKGRYDEALAILQREREVGRKLATAHPTNYIYRMIVLNSELHIGNLLINMQRLPEALATLERAREIATAIAAADPANAYPRYRIGEANQGIGEVLRQMGRYDEALPPLMQARAAKVDYVAKFPQASYARESLASCLISLALLRQQSDQPALAASLFREAVALLNALPKPTAMDFYNRACLHSRLSGIPLTAGSELTAADLQGQADTAVSLLRRAAAASIGYRDPGKLRNDADLEPLRPRADFQRLLMDLAFPADPFARGE
jgi:eukaryotic-like serine/threonine-protein kinase